jgi:hypothetical protein
MRALERIERVVRDRVADRAAQPAGFVVRLLERAAEQHRQPLGDAALRGDLVLARAGPAREERHPRVRT